MHPIESFHDRLVQLVRQLMKLNENIATVRLASEKESLRRRAGAVDAKIDDVVYHLYGLTAADIGIVEQLEDLPAISA
jgi:hypothetical protein